MESDDEGAWRMSVEERELARTRQARPPFGLHERIPLPFQTRWGPHCSADARFFTLRMYTPDKRSYNM
eukprot:10642202-Prorocentrum_lima.AAC.1